MYKATWKYNQCCLRAGQVKAECEAKSLREIAEKMMAIYSYDLGDGFSCREFNSNDQLIESEIIKDDVHLLVNQGDKAVVFSSHGFHSILINPSNSDIIRHMMNNEQYGDYDLITYRIRF